MLREHLSSVPEAIEAVRNGHMIVVVDAEDRENEGDLVIPAQFATPAAINFMAKHGRGLICLSLTGDRAGKLGLKPMVESNQSRNKTAFMNSIEAREGITTGISVYDRAHTIAVAINEASKADDIVSPGHVFPLVARNGGVLERAGHTEAAVDISRLAGLYPAGVICEIMNDDGTMARSEGLIALAKEFDLRICTIDQLISHRIAVDQPVKEISSAPFNTAFGSGFRVVVFEDTVNGIEHFAVVKGEIHPDEPTLVRIQAINPARDLLGYMGARNNFLQKAMEQIDQAGKGALIVIRDAKPKFELPQSQEYWSAYEDSESRDPAHTRYGFREAGVGAQIARLLGYGKMKMITQRPQDLVIGLSGFGLTVVGTQQF